jgi:peptide/nickel transport system substrate-binding protein
LTRLWRSRKVTFVVLLLAFALVAAACGGDGDSGDTTTTAAPADTTTTTAPPADTTTTTALPQKPYGGEAILGDDQEPPTLNAFIPGGDNFIVTKILQSYASGIQEIDGFTLEIIPELLTEMPTVENGGLVVNDDGTMTVKYTILDEAQWEDGTPVSGADFQFTYETIMNPDLPINKAFYEDIIPESIVAGDKTFEYTLTAPTVQHELYFSEILPKHSVEGSDFVADWNDQRWASSGPFVFSEWAPGESLTVVRNENYWRTDAETGQQLPFLDTVTWKFIPETEALINAFKAREIDVINPPPSVATIEELQTLEAEGARVEVLSGPIWEHLAFSFGPARLDRNPNSCNDNINMRTAVAHAIDKSLIVDEILAGQVEPMDSYVTAFTPSLSQDSWAQYTYDPATAAEFYATAVEETGTECSVVFTTTSNNDARVQLSELFVTMFADAGIPYENQNEDSQLFFGETTVNGNFDLGEWAWVGSAGLSGLVSIHDVWDPEQPPPDGSNYYQFGTEGSSFENEISARFAELRDEMNSTIDADALVTLINEAENLIADNLVIFPLYARLDPGAVWADEIGGYKHNPTNAGDTWNIAEWYRMDM